jgi:pimeloyl-ACP methyl ester carboxylesterase
MSNNQWDRTPIIISFAETVKMVETYGFVGSQGMVVLEGQLLRPLDSSSDTVYLFMHPTSTLQMLPMPGALANAGLHVLCAASRYPKNDSALIMEKVALDLVSYIRHAREVLGYAKVVLVGWSGGGMLSLFYQAQAECPTITHTPAGDPVNLVKADLPLADGIIFIAAHLSRAETLTEWLDPSVINELDPDMRDLEFDIYNPACPNQPPYSADFILAFRTRQRARSLRITEWAEAMLARFRRQEEGEVERSFVVHRTNCDPRWLDPAVDPNDRKPNWCFLGDPRIANVTPAGVARFSSLRSWLSQWSIDRTHTRGAVNAAKIVGVPVLQIENTADDAVPATHNPVIRAALATADKEYFAIEGATHYYIGQSCKLTQCIDHVIDWSRRHGFGVPR